MHQLVREDLLYLGVRAAAVLAHDNLNSKVKLLISPPKIRKQNLVVCRVVPSFYLIRALLADDVPPGGGGGQGAAGAVHGGQEQPLKREIKINKNKTDLEAARRTVL